MLLHDRVIIVTGGANGLGSLYCRNLHQEGAHVVIADRDGDNARALAAELNENGNGARAVAITVDVTSPEDTARLAAETEQQFGRIDVLLNNAGIYPHVDFDDITYEHWRQVMTLNLDSVFLCTRAVLPMMKRAGRGKIINVATNLVWIGLPSMVHYVASKAGVVGFTRALAREAGAYGITVNALAPGAVIPEGDLGEVAASRVEKIVGAQALKRPLRAPDLVGPVIFLASADSDFLSGQVLTIDGGLTTH